MKFTMYLYLVLFHFRLTGAAEIDNVLPYVSLIKWIRDYYTTSAVFLVFKLNEDKRLDDFEITHLLYSWTRLLQREQISTLSSSYENIHLFTKNNILRPLVIVIISESDAFWKFSAHTKSIKMSLFAWFVIFYSMNKQYDYCHDPPGNAFNLFYDTEMLVMCSGDPILREWYSVDGKSTKISNLMKWYPERQSSEWSTPTVDLLTNLSLYDRRKNLEGKVFRAVAVKKSLLVKVRNKRWEGYFSKAIDELADTLNFTLSLVAEETEFGIFNRTTKTWNGAFRYVASGEVDIGIADFSMTNIRLDYVDFTVPIFATRNYLFIKQPEMFAVKWFVYYKAYNFTLWMCLLVTIVTTQFVLAFIRSRTESSNIRREFFHEFIRIWGIFCQQGVTTEFPRNSSLRLAYFTVLVTAIVIYTAYSASLVSFMTARVPYVPFHSLEEFIEDGTYSVMVERGSAEYDMFSYSKEPVLSKLMKLMKPLDELPRNLETGFKRICQDPKLAFYSGYNKRVQQITTIHIPCKVAVVDFGRVDSLSLILSKNNQFTPILSYYIQKILNSGLLNRFKSEVSYVENTVFQPVGFYSVASVLIIYLCGVALALVLLLLEMYIN